MINVRERVFLICGPDFLAHQRAIESIKKRILSGRSAPLNLATLYSKELNLKTLGPDLVNTSFDKGRIIIFKEFHSLSSDAREIIAASLKKALLVNYIIFETDKDYYELNKNKRYLADKLFNFIISRAALFRAAKALRQISLVDLMESVKKKDLKKSLHVLEALFETGANQKVIGPQILGFLVNRFS